MPPTLLFAAAALNVCKQERRLEMSAYVLSTAAQVPKSQHQLQLGSKPITKEQIINALMPHTDEIITRVHPKGGHNVLYQVCWCSKGDLLHQIFRIPDYA
jgi:hypothetical protein